MSPTPGYRSIQEALPHTHHGVPGTVVCAGSSGLAWLQRGGGLTNPQISPRRVSNAGPCTSHPQAATLLACTTQVNCCLVTGSLGPNPEPHQHLPAAQPHRCRVTAAEWRVCRVACCSARCALTLASCVWCVEHPALTCDAARGVQLPEHHDEAQQVAEVAGDAEEVEKGPHEDDDVSLHRPQTSLLQNGVLFSGGAAPRTRLSQENNGRGARRGSRSWRRSA